MNILICNDDGIDSNGLIKLAEQLCKKHNVLVVAPDGNRSACSHSITLSKMIKLKEIKRYNFPAYSLSGTPVDCVKFAKLVFTDFHPDVVIAGINKGHNIGSDILYSGTVAIACEAVFFGIKAFAFSAFDLGECDFDYYAKLAEKIIDMLYPTAKIGDIWNVNFPPKSFEKIKGLKVTPLGKQLYTDRYEYVAEGEYRFTGELIEHDENPEDCDIEWNKKGYVTLTPILFNKTNYDKIAEVKDLCEKSLL